MLKQALHQFIDTAFALGQALPGHQVPPEARQHFRTARREALLGIRAVVDHALDRLDDHAEAQAGPGGGPESLQRIPIESEDPQ